MCLRSFSSSSRSAIKRFASTSRIASFGGGSAIPSGTFAGTTPSATTFAWREMSSRSCARASECDVAGGAGGVSAGRGHAGQSRPGERNPAAGAGDRGGVGVRDRGGGVVLLARRGLFG